MNKDQIELLQDLRDYLANRADVANNCPDGTTPNEEMRLLTALDEAFPDIKRLSLASAIMGNERRDTLSKIAAVDFAKVERAVMATAKATPLDWYVKRHDWFASTSKGLYAVRFYEQRRMWILRLNDKPLCETPDRQTAFKYAERHFRGEWKP